MHVSVEGSPELLTPDDVRKLTKLNVQHIRRLLVSGHLPGVKIGARWFIPKSEFERFLEERLEANHERN